jgi:hypothetical protein
MHRATSAERRRLARPGQDLDDPLAPQMSLALESEEHLHLELEITDREVVAQLVPLDGAQRQDYALTALRIGVLAMRHAQGTLDARSMRDEGERVLEQLRSALGEHSSALMLQLQGALRDYLDPESGRLGERLQRLVSQDGEISGVLRQHVGRGDSELTRTLAAHLGETSPLFRMLDPSQADGLLRRLQGLLEAALDQQREAVLRQFSLDDEGSALSRFVRQLTDQNGRLKQEFAEDLGRITGQFSLDDEGSALSRMMRLVEAAHAGLVGQFSLDDEGSSLSRMRRELREAVGELDARQDAFHRQVVAALAELSGRKEAEARSTLHGLRFEEQVGSLIQAEVRRGGDLFVHCGAQVGLIRNNKTGDYLVELGPDHEHAGARVVIEAKEDRSYDDRLALAELDEAKRNRGADVGVFVFSARTAGERDSFRRVGDDVFVVWDADDRRTDVYLLAAVSVARALVLRSRRRKGESSVDFEAMDRAIAAIIKEVERLDEMAKTGDSIRRNADRLVGEVDRLRKNLGARAHELTQLVLDARAALVVT